MLCRKESATYALLGLFPFSIFFFFPFSLFSFLSFFLAFLFEYKMVIHRPPVLNFPLKKITWSGLYRDLTRKSHKFPDTIKQEVVKSLLNYTALPKLWAKTLSGYRCHPIGWQEPTRNEDSTGQYTDQENWEPKKGTQEAIKMPTNNLPLPPSLDQIVEKNTHQVPP